MCQIEQGIFLKRNSVAGQELSDLNINPLLARGAEDLYDESCAQSQQVVSKVHAGGRVYSGVSVEDLSVDMNIFEDDSEDSEWEAQVISTASQSGSEEPDESRASITSVDSSSEKTGVAFLEMVWLGHSLSLTEPPCMTFTSWSRF